MGLKCNLIVCGPAVEKTYLASYDDRPTYKIELKKGQCLSDIKDLFF